MDATTLALLRKSFKWVFRKGFPVLSHSLLLMEGVATVKEFEGKKRKVREFKQLV